MIIIKEKVIKIYNKIPLLPPLGLKPVTGYIPVTRTTSLLYYMKGSS